MGVGVIQIPLQAAASRNHLGSSHGALALPYSDSPPKNPTERTHVQKHVDGRILVVLSCTIIIVIIHIFVFLFVCWKAFFLGEGSTPGPDIKEVETLRHGFPKVAAA